MQQKTDQLLQDNNTYAATSSGSLCEQCGFVIIIGLPTCESNALMMLSSAFRMLKKKKQDSLEINMQDVWHFPASLRFLSLAK